MLKPDSLIGETVEVRKLEISGNHKAKFRWFNSIAELEGAEVATLDGALWNFRDKLGAMGKKIQQAISEIDQYTKENGNVVGQRDIYPEDETS